jgi:Tfp pilus assembly protein PilV
MQVRHKQQQGFTLLEAAIAMVMLMIIGLGIASLFTYAIHANGNADDRMLSMALAQKRMEWLRTIPFTTQTRHESLRPLPTPVAVIQCER